MLEFNGFREKLEAELSEMQKLSENLKELLEDAPEGSLHILKRKQRKASYYWHQGKKQRKYIPHANISDAEKLAQKAYNHKLQALLEKRIVMAKALLKQYQTTIQSLYEPLSDARKELVVPCAPSDQEYVANWMERYSGGQNEFPFKSEIYTNRGEQVRSKSEKILADLFYKRGIPYVYEPRLMMRDGRYVCPDFLTLNMKYRKTIVFEHWGKMSDGEYAQRNCEKLHRYQKNGFLLGDNLMITMESNETVLDTRLVESLLDRYF